MQGLSSYPRTFLSTRHSTEQPAEKLSSVVTPYGEGRRIALVHSTRPADQRPAWKTLSLGSPRPEDCPLRSLQLFRTQQPPSLRLSEIPLSTSRRETTVLRTLTKCV